jgi:hypothetical protein
MAEEILVKDSLNPEMIEAGRRLTEQLDRSGLPLSASMWLYVPDSNEWRLILASPRVDSEGPKKAYQEVRNVLVHLPGAGLSLRNISLVEPENPLVALLRGAVRTGSGISGIRFSRNTINGHFIEDAYIYRLAGE